MLCILKAQVLVRSPRVNASTVLNSVMPKPVMRHNTAAASSSHLITLLSSL